MNNKKLGIILIIVSCSLIFSIISNANLEKKNEDLLKENDYLNKKIIYKDVTCELHYCEEVFFNYFRNESQIGIHECITLRNVIEDDINWTITKDSYGYVGLGHSEQVVNEILKEYALTYEDCEVIQ